MEHKLTLSKAGHDFPEVVERAYRHGEVTVVMKSGVAVARVVPPRPLLLGRDLAKLDSDLTHLTPEDAKEFAKELQKAKDKCPDLNLCR